MEVNFNVVRGIGEIPHKKPGKLSVGFEWEIPLHEEHLDVVDDYDWECDYDSSMEWLEGEFGVDLQGMRGHIECGGLEIAFPKTNHLNHTKALIRKAKDFAYKYPDLLDPEYTGRNSDCGIHVHVSAPEEITEVAVGMLNRASSKEFIWAISGRENGKFYSRQATASSWDTMGEGSPYQIEAMLRWQWDFKTLEFRLFGPHPDVLERAVEFSHSVVKFLSSRKSKKIPYLYEWRDWVMKQKGYPVLKKEAPWELIKSA